MIGWEKPYLWLLINSIVDRLAYITIDWQDTVTKSGVSPLTHAKIRISANGWICVRTLLTMRIVILKSPQVSKQPICRDLLCSTQEKQHLTVLNKFPAKNCCNGSMWFSFVHYCVRNAWICFNKLHENSDFHVSANVSNQIVIVCWVNWSSGWCDYLGLQQLTPNDAR